MGPPSSPPKSLTLGRSWCYTAFEREHVDRLHSSPNIVVHVCGEERCPRTGRLHYQGYIRFSVPVRFSWWKNQFPSLHVEGRRGSESQAMEYCRKEGNVVLDLSLRRPPAVEHSRRRQSGDVESSVNARLRAGETVKGIHDDHPIYVMRNARMLRTYVRILASWGYREDGDSSNNMSGVEL